MITLKVLVDLKDDWNSVIISKGTIVDISDDAVGMADNGIYKEKMYNVSGFYLWEHNVEIV